MARLGLGLANGVGTKMCPQACKIPPPAESVQAAHRMSADRYVELRWVHSLISLLLSPLGNMPRTYDFSTSNINDKLD